MSIASELHKIADQIEKNKIKESLIPLYEKLCENCKKCASVGLYSYTYTIGFWNNRMPNTRYFEKMHELNQFKEDFPILKEMLEDCGFIVESDIDNCVMNENLFYHITIKW